MDNCKVNVEKQFEEVKAVYIKPVIMPLEDVFSQIVPLGRSVCYTSSGR